MYVHNMILTKRLNEPREAKYLPGDELKKISLARKSAHPDLNGDCSTHISFINFSR